MSTKYWSQNLWNRCLSLIVNSVYCGLSGGFNTTQLAAESVSKACFGVHTRDF